MAAALMAMTAFTRASVCCDAVETEYLRAGRGAPIVYIGSSATADEEGTALLHGLASHFRVIVPLPKAAPATLVPDDCLAAPFASWLRGVLDGLGIVTAGFVVERPAACAMLAFARDNPDFVERVVLLGAAPHEHSGDAPVLALAPNAPDALDSMIQFLAT